MPAIKQVSINLKELKSDRVYPPTIVGLTYKLVIKYLYTGNI